MPAPSDLIALFNTLSLRRTVEAWDALIPRMVFRCDQSLLESDEELRAALAQMRARDPLSTLIRHLFGAYLAVWKGELHSAERRLEQASTGIKHFRKVRNGTRKTLLAVELSLLVTRVYCNRHLLDKASQELDWLQKSPRSPRQECHFCLAQAFFAYRCRQLNDAGRWLDEAKQNLQGMTGGSADLLQVRVRSLMGQIAARKGQSGLAVRSFYEAAMFAEKAPRPDREKAEVYAKLSRAHRQMGDLIAAMHAGQLAVALAEQARDAYLQALAHHRLGDAFLKEARRQLLEMAHDTVNARPDPLVANALERAREEFLRNDSLSARPDVCQPLGSMMAQLGLTRHAILEYELTRNESLLDRADQYIANAECIALRELGETHPDVVAIDRHRARLAVARKQFETAHQCYQGVAERLEKSNFAYRAAEVLAEEAEAIYRCLPDQRGRALQLAAKACRLVGEHGACPLPAEFAAALAKMPPEQWLRMIPSEVTSVPPPPHKSHDLVAGLIHEAKRISRTMERTLAHGRDDSIHADLAQLHRLLAAALQGYRPAWEAFDLVASVIRVVDRSRPLGKRLNRRLTSRLQKGLNAVVQGDRELIELALETLLENSLEYGGDIVVSAKQIRGGRSVQVCIEDTGPGVPEKVRRSLERGDLRVPSGSSESSRGWGLPFARRVIIDHLGGTFEDVAPGGKRRRHALVLCMPLCG